MKVLVTGVPDSSGQHPRKAILRMEEMQPGDVYHTSSDTSCLQQDFGYCPATTIEEGIHRFYEWYKEFYKRCVRQASDTGSLRGKYGIVTIKTKPVSYFLQNYVVPLYSHNNYRQ